MRITACPRCGSRRIYAGTMGDGVLVGYTTKDVCRDCGYQGMPLIFGMVAGFGFAATENLLYGMKFWNEGFIVLISLFYLRTIGSGFLHASATALTGYGYGLKVIKKRPFKSILPFFLIAIAIHSIFNLFALSSQITNQIFGTVIAATFAVTLLILIRKKVLILDRKSMHLEIQ